MSEYSFDGFDPNDELGAGEPQGQQAQGPKWFRDYMDKVSGQLKDLQAKNDALESEKKQHAVADALKAKGYAPQAAGLFTGEPDKLDDWLTANGGALAKLPTDGREQQGEQQTQTGPPPTTVPADGQAQMQRMQEQGTQGVAPPQGSDKEQAAAIAAIQDDEAFAQYMKANGSPFDWS